MADRQKNQDRNLGQNQSRQDQSRQERSNLGTKQNTSGQSAGQNQGRNTNLGKQDRSSEDTSTRKGGSR